MSTTATPMPVEPSLSEVQRITGVFYQPSVTFADVKTRPSWWAPFLLMCVVALIFVFSVDKKITFAQVQQNMMGNMSEKQKDRIEQLPPEQRERQQSIMLKSIRYSSYAWPILALIFTAIIAAVVMAVFNFGLAAGVTFKQAFAVCIYSAMPGLVKTLLAVALIWGGMNPENFNLENPVITNPGTMVAPSEHPALYALLASFDVFTFWTIIVMGIGFAVVATKKLKTSTGIATVFALFIFVRLIAVCWAALMA